ncbi:MAG: hypothetical protein HND59_05415 [Pseudomonadota bacterium]|nr:MAG: hypothetical protein HND59_05415 [Pseudomonadota bacterium]
MRATKRWRKSTGCIALLVSIASTLAQGVEPAAANRVANDQWSFAVAERRMQEIHAIGAQLTALSREALPTGLSAAERTELARFTHWLYNSARKFHHLARGWGRLPQKSAAQCCRRSNPTGAAAGDESFLLAALSQYGQQCNGRGAGISFRQPSSTHKTREGGAPDRPSAVAGGVSLENIFGCPWQNGTKCPIIGRL